MIYVLFIFMFDIIIERIVTKTVILNCEVATPCGYSLDTHFYFSTVNLSKCSGACWGLGFSFSLFNNTPR